MTIILNNLATRQYSPDRTYDEMIWIVHVYIIEPHPRAPDPSPYTGEVWEGEFSDRLQALTYPERVESAKDMGVELEGEQILLVDDLTPGLNNPIWCTYGTCPNCAFLIDQDQKLVSVQGWIDEEIQLEVDSLLEN